MSKKKKKRKNDSFYWLETSTKKEMHIRDQGSDRGKFQSPGGSFIGVGMTDRLIH